MCIIGSNGFEHHWIITTEISVTFDWKNIHLGNQQAIASIALQGRRFKTDLISVWGSSGKIMVSILTILKIQKSNSTVFRGAGDPDPMDPPLWLRPWWRVHCPSLIFFNRFLVWLNVYTSRVIMICRWHQWTPWATWTWWRRSGGIRKKSSTERVHSFSSTWFTVSISITYDQNSC